MTAAGLALIAGGLATLICFRSVLFGAARRRGSRRRSALAGRSAELGAAPVALLGGAGAHAAPAGHDPVDEDLRDLVAEAEEYEAEVAFLEELRADPDEPLGEGFLAPADDGYPAEPELVEDALEEAAFEDAAFPEAPFQQAAFEEAPFDVPPVTEEPVPFVAAFDPPPLDEPAFTPAPLDEPAFAPISLAEDPVPRTDDRYGHRIDGWVRPEYRHVPEEPPAGEYWTPIPVQLDPDPEPSAKGYGWPTPVERLPAVPSYEPATGFDLAPVEHEPTEVVTSWSGADERAGRIRLPRDWAARNEKRRDERPVIREWRDEVEPAPGQRVAAVGQQPRPATRRRPRPRPRPSLVTPPDRSTTVYVSRHAAEPPR